MKYMKIWMMNHYATEMFLTEVEAEDKEADVFFPSFDQKIWKRTVILTQTYKNLSYSFVHYEKNKQEKSL